MHNPVAACILGGEKIFFLGNRKPFTAGKNKSDLRIGEIFKRDVMVGDYELVILSPGVTTFRAPEKPHLGFICST
jgi:hypothetical protein